MSEQKGQISALRGTDVGGWGQVGGKAEQRGL